MKETEQRLLAACLESEDALIEIEHHIKPDDFTDPVHRELYKTMLNHYEQGKHLSTFELLKEMRTNPKDAEKVKEIAYWGMSSNLEYWIERLKNFSKKRKINAILKETAQNLQHKEADELITELENQIYQLNVQDEADEILTPHELAMHAVDLVTKKYNEEKGKLEGLHLGLNKLSWEIGGAKPGDLILLGARTGHGKTAMALNIARRVALVDKQPVLYLNTEMSKEQVAYRIAGMLSAVDIQKIRYGKLTEEEFLVVTSELRHLDNSQFYSYYCPNLNMAKLVSTVRKFKRQKGIKLVILDYIGRMDKLRPDLQEWQVLEQAVKTCKILAQNERVAFLVLIQMNDDGTIQGAKRMKNEADIMLRFEELSKEELEELQEEFPNLKVTHAVYIDKNRDGPAGKKTPVLFIKEKQIISEPESMKNWYEDVG
ncbi:MAG: AAA family ATPase [Thermoanaerobacteraceae bacterium]|nr:AAA family ATPase [Thermoanaerobacteraceae bacterium]